MTNLTDQNQTPEAPTSLSDKVTLATLLFKFMGILERVLPAFLVAWNNKLREDNKKLELKIEKKEIDDKVKQKVEEIKNDSSSDEEIVNKFLNS